MVKNLSSMNQHAHGDGDGDGDDDDDIKSVNSLSVASIQHSSFGGSHFDHEVGANQKKKQDANDVKQIASKETKQIWVWKFLVIFIIIATAALVSTGSYIFLQQEEDDDFNGSYDQFVNTIRDASEFHAENIFTALRSFSATITVEAVALNQTFPFVTIPSFEALGAGVRVASGAEMINWHVLVEQDQLEEWSRYSLANYETALAQSRAIALTLDAAGSSVKSSDFIDGPIAPFPYMPNFEEGGLIMAPNYGPGPYFPAWMVSPPIFNPNFINSDPAPWALKAPISAVLEARAMVFTDSVPVENLANRAIKLEDHEAYHASLVDYVQDPSANTFSHPHSSVMVPVFEKLNDPTSKIVGTFAVVIPWDRYLVNLLPDNIDGLVCVLRNSCGKAWTYVLEGNSAFYIGEGDFHDHAYNYTEVELPFEDTIQASENDVETVPGECSYSYFIYASQEFEDDYRSNLPWALTLVVASTFAVMIISFLVYDNFVRQRNDKVVGHATRTNAIVTSLFPEQVRNRLMDEQEQDSVKGGGANGAADSNNSFLSGESERSTFDRSKKSNARLQGFLNGGMTSSSSYGDVGAAMKKSAPIADLYPECTVYFADIVGFTRWSSAREPVEVFTLLEGIYHEFDRIAKRRGVFKVETIGDCYVAITGLPQPRPHHALAMAKFAADTLDKMRMVIRSLESTLGADTARLDLRIGLHSGPVTAGVLRGERARFQLFGDTVNTAARMESNSQRGRIQISEDTASHLREAGKENWLSARDDMVNAKGKGKMQTYWLTPYRKASTIGTSASSNGEEDDDSDVLGGDELLDTLEEEKEERNDEDLLEVGDMDPEVLHQEQL